MLNQKAEEFLQKYCIDLANTAGVANITKQFSLSNPMDTRLREAILHSAEFLQMIYCCDVDQLAGQVVVTGTSQLLTGRKAGGRFVRKLGVDGNTYKLSETDSCAAIDWATLSVWANSGDEGQFFRMMQNFMDKQFALDMIRVGFNGTHVSDTTDPELYPNGEDINKGWHQIAKEWDNGAQVLTSPVTLGVGGTYATLDAMASDLVNHLPIECRNNPDIVIFVGSELLAAEQFRLYSKADTPTENLAAAQLDTIVAGKKAIVPPFMPGKRIVATTLKNLHIYTQKGSRRRAAEDVQDRKQFENKYWRNEGFALEIPEMYVAIDESAISLV